MADETQAAPATETAATTAPAAAAPAAASQIPQNVRNLHNKALNALERKNFDFAIDLFFKCIELAPQYHVARKNLRLAEIAKFKREHMKDAALAHKIAGIKGLFAKGKVTKLIASGKAVEAMLESEKLLRTDPLSIPFATLFAKAAIAAGMPDAGVETMELLREHEPQSLEVLETLGRLYSDLKRYGDAQECLSKVALMRPNDPDINRLLKSVEALMTLNNGIEQANESGDFRKALANADQALQLQRKDKAVKTEADAESLIAEAREKIEKEPGNINYYLSLGNLYTQQKRYEEAIQVFEQARQVATQDPEIDRRYSAARISKYDQDIAALREAGDENGAVALENERAQYVFDDLYERSQRYPNDLRIRYELGLQYFQNDYFDEAIQQFQLAQRSPKDRAQALTHLALCFRHKGMLDLAAEQLEQALESVSEMGPEKMQILYELGDLYQQLDRLDDADKLFKEIYRYDMSYRDIAKKVEGIYAAKRAAREAAKAAPKG